MPPYDAARAGAARRSVPSARARCRWRAAAARVLGECGRRLLAGWRRAPMRSRSEPWVLPGRDESSDFRDQLAGKQ